MIEDPIDSLRKGSVGTFQPLVEPPMKKWFAGHMQIGADGAVIAVVASKKRDPRGAWADHSENNQVVAGITEAGTILAPVRWTQRTTTRGQHAVRVVRWHASNVLVDIPFEEIDGENITAANLRYLGFGSWSGDSDHMDEPTVEEGVGVVGWRIEVASKDERSVAIDDDYALIFKHDWTLGGPFDNRSLHKPLRIGVRSTDRRPMGEHLERLDALHALLSVAHKKPVTATDGLVQLDPDSRHRAKLWDRTMMSDSIGPDTNEFPIFTLSDINDLEGVAAWVTTCLTKRRAVAPIVRHRLFENQTPEARFLYTAAALEYWVASNARNQSADWAKDVRSKFHVPHAITKSVSDEWATWIGDKEHWADLFSGTYTRLKHTAADVDLDAVDALEYSARWLLTASILDRCAGSQSASQRIFTRGLTYPVADNIRSILDDLPVPEDDNRR